MNKGNEVAFFLSLQILNKIIFHTSFDESYWIFFFFPFFYGILFSRVRGEEEFSLRDKCGLCWLIEMEWKMF